jgi:hypothetical protein
MERPSCLFTTFGNGSPRNAMTAMWAAVSRNVRTDFGLTDATCEATMTFGKRTTLFVRLDYPIIESSVLWFVNRLPSTSARKNHGLGPVVGHPRVFGWHPLSFIRADFIPQISFRRTGLKARPDKI